METSIAENALTTSLKRLHREIFFCVDFQICEALPTSRSGAEKILTNPVDSVLSAISGAIYKLPDCTGRHVAAGAKKE
ncbi:MAG: hypothetical protein KDK27_05425 [Leptospiraceae bacterium]|nr:hypothetical protein [Leptospiraceae bacterium]